ESVGIRRSTDAMYRNMLMINDHLPVLVFFSGRPTAIRSNALRINGTIEPAGQSRSQRSETTPTTATTTAATSCGYNSFAPDPPMRLATALANSLCAVADALRTSP